MNNVTLHPSQNAVFEKFVASLNQSNVQNGKVLFVHGAAGAGKTFLLNYIASYCKQVLNKSFIAVAYTGIAACSLIDGKTVHSKFRLPWNRSKLQCSIEKQHPLYTQIQSAEVIVWDQAAMCGKHIFEEVDAFLRQMMATETIFGGKTAVICGDFRECLPIVPKTNNPPESYSILQSSLWPRFQQFSLNENARFSSEYERSLCLEIGNGKIESISIPKTCRVDTLDDLIKEIYAFENFFNSQSEDLMQRNIVSVLNKDVHMINGHCLKILYPEVVYMQSKNYFRKIDDEQGSRFISMEEIRLPKYFPPDVIQLQEGCPIVLIQAYKGLTQGTRLIIKKIYRHKIVAEIGCGRRKGNSLIITKVPSSMMMPSANLEFIRRQYPVQLAFSMTINKVQGLEFNKIGVYFPRAAFSHGQMYVACSRVSNMAENLKVVVEENRDLSYIHMPNIVNPSIAQYLQNI